jgi:SAM-dependent methyltransferase
MRLTPMARSPSCPICAADGRLVFVAGEHRMFRCAGCRTAFVAPMPSAEFLERFYAEFHRTLEAGGGYEHFETRNAADFPAKIRLVRAHLGPGRHRLLDVGCGKGHFVRACLDRGLDASGIDLSSTAIAVAREAGVPAVCGRLEDHCESLGTFDAITFWATIEHVPDPIATLGAIRGVVKPGGYVFLDTGAGDDWLDRLLPGFVSWYDPPQHLFVFSRRGLAQALARSGFEAVRIDPCFERNALRRLARIARGAAAAAGLRAVASLTRLKPGPLGFTRFPLGNPMLAVARATG